MLKAISKPASRTGLTRSQRAVCERQSASDDDLRMIPSELHAMLRNDESHWWYRGRRRVIAAALGRLPLQERAQLLDAGCGSGRTLDMLAEYGSACGVDSCAEAVAFAQRRGHADVQLGRIQQLEFDPER